MYTRAADDDPRLRRLLLFFFKYFFKLFTPNTVFGPARIVVNRDARVSSLSEPPPRWKFSPRQTQPPPSKQYTQKKKKRENKYSRKMYV